MKHIITILLLFLSINVFGQMPTIWNSNSGSKKMNIGTWTMKVQYPYNICGAETGLVFFNNPSNIPTQPKSIKMILLSSAGIYATIGCKNTYDGGNVLGWSTYMATDLFMIGWKPIQFTFTNGKARITIGPSIFYQRVYTGWADTSGNQIGWTQYDYERQQQIVDNGYRYKEFGIGLHLNLNRVVTFATYICRSSISFGLGVWLGL